MRFVEQRRQHSCQLWPVQVREHIATDALGGNEVQFVVDTAQHPPYITQFVPMQVAEVGEHPADPVKLHTQGVRTSRQFGLSACGLPLKTDGTCGCYGVQLTLLTAVARVLLHPAS